MITSLFVNAVIPIIDFFLGFGALALLPFGSLVSWLKGVSAVTPSFVSFLGDTVYLQLPSGFFGAFVNLISLVSSGVLNIFDPIFNTLFNFSLFNLPSFVGILLSVGIIALFVMAIFAVVKLAL